MKFLTRQEELVLLVVYYLKERATLKSIRERLITQTGKDWSISSVYVPLDRLAETGFLETILGEPTGKRGGRAKKYYRITVEGAAVLKEMREITETMWKDIERLAVEGM